MSHELEEFLRRAAERRAAKGSAARPVPPSKQPEQIVPTPAKPVRRLEQLDEVVDAVILGPPTGEILAQHVQQHLNTAEIAERVSHLGEKAGQADEAIQAHLHQAFDHKLGRLSGSTASITADDAPATAGTSTTTNIAQIVVEMLRNPQSVRASLILNEILKRPGDQDS